MINSIRRLLTVVSTLALMMVLSGCSEEEQDRILQYEKGVISGKGSKFDTGTAKNWIYSQTASSFINLAG